MFVIHIHGFRYIRIYQRLQQSNAYKILGINHGRVSINLETVSKQKMSEINTMILADEIIFIG